MPDASPAKAAGRGGVLWRWTLAAVILVICASFLEIAEVSASLSRLSGGALLAVAALTASERLIAVWKWSVLLRARGVAVPLRRVCAVYFYTWAVGKLLPSQIGGEILRAHVLGKESRMLPAVAATIVMDRGMGVVIAVNLMLLGLVLLAVSGERSQLSLVLSLALICALAINGLFALSCAPGAHAFVARRTDGAPRGRLLGFAAKVLGQYGALGSAPRVLGGLGLLTLLGQGIQLWVVYRIASGMGADGAAIPLLGALLVYLFFCRAPVAPAGFGVGEISAIGVLGLAGMPPEMAFGLAFLRNVVNLVMGLVLAAAALATPAFHR